MSTPKRLYLFVGYPGAGKTTIARLIAAETGAVHLWADKERLQMFGEPTHAPAESAKLYAYLNKKAEDLLAGGQSVIFDTNFNFRRDRDHMRQIASKQGAETVLIWMTTPRDIARARAIETIQGSDTRILGAMPSSDFQRISHHLQPPGTDEYPICLDGTNLDMEAVKRTLGL